MVLFPHKVNVQMTAAKNFLKDVFAKSFGFFFHSLIKLVTNSHSNNFHLKSKSSVENSYRDTRSNICKGFSSFNQCGRIYQKDKMTILQCDSI